MKSQAYQTLFEVLNEKKLTAQIMILFLLIFSIPSLANQVTANAQSANATSLDVFSGNVLPLFLSAISLIWLGYIIWELVRQY